MFTKEKPGSPEEILTHHGTKGMKWGVRTQSTRQFRRKFSTRGARATEIHRARQEVRNKPFSALKKDRETALRLTAGEKFTATLLGVALPVAGTAAVGAFVAVRGSQRRAIAKSTKK